MKIKVFFGLLMPIFIFNSCTTLLPVTTIKNGNVEDFKFAYILPTNSITSNHLRNINGTYYSSSTSVNPSEVISGILSKKGMVILPSQKNGLEKETLIINYGESGRRDTGLGSYTMEVTIQFISSESNKLICSCTAEGQGSTQADDIRQAITRCITSIFPSQIAEK